MPTKKKPTTPARALPTISMQIDEKLFARAHAYRYRADVRASGKVSLKALVVAALEEYLTARKA